MTTQKKCGACDGTCPKRHYAKGYCKSHYTQVLRHGALTPELERGAVRVCRAEACGRTDTIHFYCRRHARQLRVHGRLTPELEYNRSVGCSVAGCDQPHRAKGLCAKHYNQARSVRKYLLDRFGEPVTQGEFAPKGGE